MLTAGCTPLAAAGGGHSTGVKRPAVSGHLTFLPTEDAFIYGNPQSATNTGASPQLVVSPMPDQGTAAYLKFLVSGVPAGRYVTSAKLILHRAGTTELPSTLNVAMASSSWSEMTINGGNAPSLSAVVASAHPKKTARALTVDVSAAFKASNGPYTFTITNPVADSVASFVSRQGGGGNAPTLVVNYGANKPASTPSGNPTPTPSPEPTPTPTPTRPHADSDAGPDLDRPDAGPDLDRPDA